MRVERSTADGLRVVAHVFTLVAFEFQSQSEE